MSIIKIKVLIDNGHGFDTRGKLSPDQLLMEWEWTREIAARITAGLKQKGIDAALLTPETNDVSLKQRVDRANRLCSLYGNRNVLVVSVHVNAAGSDGKWKTAGGWCAFTSKGQTRSDIAAEYLYDAAEKYLKDYAKMLDEGKKTGAYDQKQRAFRTDKTDKDRDLEENFYILYHTLCPAVLTENCFMDNKSDCDWLLSDEGKEAIVQLHIEGIVNYINNSK